MGLMHFLSPNQQCQKTLLVRRLEDCVTVLELVRILAYCLQGAYRSWKTMKFKIQIFQAWKVMELGLAAGKSWKVDQMVAAFLTRVHVFGLYIHYHCPLSDLVQSVV